MKRGIPETTLDALGRYEDSPLFSERERSALAFAGELTRGDGEVSDACFERLRAHFDEAQTVELAFVVGYQLFASRFAKAFKLSPQGFSELEARRSRAPGTFTRRVALVVPLLIGVSLATGQPADVSAVAIRVGDNMRFVPPEIHARPGQRMRIALTNDGKTAVKHTFVLLKKGTDPRRFVDQLASAGEPRVVAPGTSDRVIAATEFVSAGQSRDVTFEAPTQAGEYPFVCTVPGHLNLGMRGRLIVE